MDRVIWDQKPKLRSPTLVCSFKGWNDAAESASSALRFLATQWDAEQIGAIDCEDFFDFQVSRPTVKLTEGLTREIEWPDFVISSAVLTMAERDVVFLVGNEPNLHWKTFGATVIGAARELGVRQVVSLGALLADVPHTRPVQVTGIAGDENMAKRLGFSQTRYEGPTGIVGVLHDACARDGLESASLWAPVPHYVAAVPSPRAALALLRRLEGLVGVAVEASGLEEEAESYESQVSRAVAANPEIEELVKRLEEEQSDRLDIEEDVPSGESLARDFERYLRQQGNY